jgi:hypothetical protein
MFRNPCKGGLEPIRLSMLGKTGIDGKIVSGKPSR